jgi:hypothetical protein
MAVVMIMEWDGVTPASYDAVRRRVNWEGEPAPGGLYHVAAFDDRVMRVTDIWESAEQLNDFVQNRLMPGVKAEGIQGQPRVEVFPVHAVFAPGYQRV